MRVFGVRLTVMLTIGITAVALLAILSKLDRDSERLRRRADFLRRARSTSAVEGMHNDLAIGWERRAAESRDVDEVALFSDYAVNAREWANHSGRLADWARTNAISDWPEYPTVDMAIRGLPGVGLPPKKHLPPKP